MKHIALPKSPDADTLVAAWLVANHLFDDESSAVVFVNGKRPAVADLPALDCAVGVWDGHDPFCVSFKTGSPVRAERGGTCVTRSVWEYLVAQGKPLEHMAKLVAVIEEGKNATESPSAALQASLTSGLHAFVRQQKAMVPDDHAVFRAVCRWLHSYECAALRSCARQAVPVWAVEAGH